MIIIITVMIIIIIIATVARILKKLGYYLINMKITSAVPNGEANACTHKIAYTNTHTWYNLYIL